MKYFEKAILMVLVCVGLFWLAGASIWVDLSTAILIWVFIELCVKPVYEYLTK